MVIPVKDAEYFPETLNSILQQTLTDLEVIVITEPEVHVQLEDFRIIHIHNAKHLGISQACNLGFAKSTGKYVARTDADDLNHPNRFQQQVDFLEAHPEIGIVGTQADYVSESGGYLTHRFLWPGRRKFVGKTRPRVPTDPNELEIVLRHRMMFFGPTILMRREVLEKLGGYCEDYDICEDYEFLLRTLNNGFKIANLGDYLYKQRMHVKQFSKRFLPEDFERTFKKVRGEGIEE